MAKQVQIIKYEGDNTELFKRICADGLEPDAKLVVPETHNAILIKDGVLMDTLKDDDLLIITADHGCDPTTPGTDHTREYIPILVYGKQMKQGVDLGIRSTFADIAATVSEYLTGETWQKGTSFLNEMR